MNQVMPMSILVMIIHVVLLDWVMNIFQRSEYEPSDAKVHRGQPKLALLAMCGLALCD